MENAMVGIIVRANLISSFYLLVVGIVIALLWSLGRKLYWRFRNRAYLETSLERLENRLDDIEFKKSLNRKRRR